MIIKSTRVPRQQNTKEKRTKSPNTIRHFGCAYIVTKRFRENRPTPSPHISTPIENRLQNNSKRKEKASPTHVHEKFRKSKISNMAAHMTRKRQRNEIQNDGFCDAFDTFQTISTFTATPRIVKQLEDDIPEYLVAT